MTEGDREKVTALGFSNFLLGPASFGVIRISTGLSSMLT